MSVPTSTRAAILVENNQPLTVDTIALPQSLDAGQVLVRVLVSGICGSQLGEIDGVKGPDKFLPHLLGHEGTGEVAAVGPGVRTVKPGDRVVLHWRKGDGIDASVPAYDWNGRRVNAGWVTTFQEWSVVSENRVTVISPDSDVEAMALMGCAVTTGFGVVANNANVEIGESVVVFGAGGVGLNIIQACAMSSAHPIVAVDLFDNRLALAKTMGATHLINARNEDARARIAEILGPAGPDVFFDNTGKPDIIAMGYEIAKPDGRVILVGVPRKGANISIYSLPLHFGKILTGSHGGDAQPARDIPRFERLFSQGKLQLKELISERFPLERINDAIAAMRDGRITGRCLIDMR